MSLLSAAVESEFLTAVKQALRLLLRRGPATLAGLAQEMEGAFPRDIESALQRMMVSDEVRRAGGLYVLRALGAQSRSHRVSVTPGPPEQTFNVFLPTPHPVDFDWRFTSGTAKRVARMARAIAGDGSICVFGAPTAFLALATSGGNAHLVEKNPYIADLVSGAQVEGVIEADLLKPLENTRPEYGVVIADPPWYREHYQAFISQAALVLRPEGILMISMLPRLTRPGASDDRQAAVRLALDCGFEVAGYFSKRVRYETPLFERATLLASGLDCGDWRRGDLCMLRLVRPNRNVAQGLIKILSTEEFEDGRWRSFHFSGRQVRVRVRDTDPRERFVAEPVGDYGPLLPTVSRRYPLRNKIDVWSDRNEAWHVSRVDVVIALLERLSCQSLGDAVSIASTEFKLDNGEVAELVELASHLCSNVTEEVNARL